MLEDIFNICLKTFKYFKRIFKSGDPRLSQEFGVFKETFKRVDPKSSPLSFNGLMFVRCKAWVVKLQTNVK
jgi:hypothetical protein